MARYKFRDLSSRADTEAIADRINEHGEARRQRRRPGSSRRTPSAEAELVVMAAEQAERAAVALSAVAETPQQVEAIDGEADEEQLVEELREGSLEPRDLVFFDGRWMTFAEAPPFEEVCREVESQEGTNRLLIGGVVALAVIAALLLFLAR